jgi:hypothetical protein
MKTTLLSTLVLGAIAVGCSQSAPKIYNVTPNEGPTSGGTTITIQADHLDRPTIWVGGAPCTNVNLVAGGCTAQVPSNPTPDTYLITLSNVDEGTAHWIGFTYVATSSLTQVVVSAVNPAQGSAGTPVTVGGAGFDANATVRFGSNPASSVVVQSPTQITCVAPAGSGIESVTVTNTDGTTGTLAAAFTYPGTSGSTGTIIAAYAGDGTNGYAGDGGAATSAELSAARGLALFADGTLYVADTGNNVIRVISPSGTIKTYAGNGTAGLAGDGGKATSAELSQPAGLALDTASNLYIADAGNDAIRLVTFSSGTISTVAGMLGVSGNSGDGGTATSALLAAPEAVAVDSQAVVYVADTGNNRVRSVSGGTISAFAGTGSSGFGGDNGTATSALLSSPAGIAVNTSGVVFIADTGNARIRQVVAGKITTFAGGGTASVGSGTGSGGLGGLGGSGTGTGSTGTSSVGDGGAATSATLQAPTGIALDGQGSLYIADSVANRVRVVSLSTLVIETLAGTGTAGNTGDGGPATSAEINAPRAVTSNGTVTYIADSGNFEVRQVP